MSKQRAKGTRVENQAVTVFAPLFRFCERRALRGVNDGGDLAGLPIPVECKANVGAISEAMKEAKAAAARIGVTGYAAYLHARGKHPSEAYFVTPAWFGAELLAAWDHAQSQKPMSEVIDHHLLLTERFRMDVEHRRRPDDDEGDTGVPVA